ncbi:hypothetical protein HPB48_015464 [Haemaphysalis longicornis]|uniref:CRAL/TRIO N-terminal domain-containing protein n=1 Tax=Haemaphysalis longicornis TaxID=44386 RepID=A0A9J6FPC2_HAELO|nr:hypothetical protein HPB48_015464 [Haemaphysalis longicornis]
MHHSDEPFLHCPVDDAFLLTFLRVRKFKVNKSFESIKTFCRLLTDNPEVFDNLDPFNVPFDAVCRQSKQFTLSRKTDPEGRPVFLSKEGKWCMIRKLNHLPLILISDLIFRRLTGGYWKRKQLPHCTRVMELPVADVK